MKHASKHRSFVAICLVLAATSIGLCVHATMGLLPASVWWDAALSPDPTSLPQLTLHYVTLPRIACALIVGAALSLAGVLMQLVLRNPAAEPATLGVAPGAFLAVAAASIWMPTILQENRTAVALVGGALAGFLVFAIASRSRFNPQVLLLAGLLIGLLVGALNTLLIMLHGGLIRLFVWDSGSLVMQDWSVFSYLVPRLLPACLVSFVFVRPISLLALSDEAAHGLGGSPTLIRTAVLALAVWMAAVCVAAVGVIGFLGIAAGEIVRSIGYRRVRAQLMASAVIGALLLLCTDQILQALDTPSEIPAGAAAAFIGAPLLLWLMGRHSPRLVPLIEHVRLARRVQRPVLVMGLLANIAVLAAVTSLLVGRGMDAWTFAGLSSPEATLFWRGPRLVAGAAASILVSISGVIVQRLTLNPLASPEMLGISAGAACGVIVAILIPAGGAFIPPLLGMAGGGLVLTLIFVFGRRSRFAPHNMMMVGIAVTTCFSAVMSVLMSSGDPRMFDLMAWLSGSTFLAQPWQAFGLAAAAMLALASVPLLSRWLALLPLGMAVPRALGMSLEKSRGLLIAFASALIGLSVLMIGPLSFVGLMAPHMARMLGFRRPLAEIAAASLIGCCLMIVADWLGRNLLFPDQIPAGLIATLIAAPYMLVLMASRS